MTVLIHLWWLWLIAVVGFIYVYVKKETISAVTSAAKKAAKKKFFGWVSDNLPAQKPSTERTYRGPYWGQHYSSNFAEEHWFTIIDDGKTTTVPFHPTELLTVLSPGDIVEIDTDVLPNSTVEVIRRVRVIEHQVLLEDDGREEPENL